MNPAFFGDSFDIVKREVIRGLAEPEGWAVHPMYFDAERDDGFDRRHAEFLGIDLAKGNTSDRKMVVEVGEKCQRHLFLDPDTGLRVPGKKERGHGQHRKKHLNVPELAEITIAQRRKHKLTLVFDQSNVRNKDRRENVKERLKELRSRKRKIYGAAYVCKHVVFIWVSHNEDTVENATHRLIDCSGLPVCRFVGVGAGHRLPLAIP